MATEPAERDIMRRRPRPPRESIFARGLGVHVLWVGLFMAALTLGAQAWLVRTGTVQPHWQTMTFTMLCFVQLGHVLAVRSERDSLWTQGLLTNRLLLGAVTLTIVLQLTIIYVPTFNRVFKTQPLTFVEMGIAIGGACAVLGAVEVEKWLRKDQAAGVLLKFLVPGRRQ